MGEKDSAYDAIVAERDNYARLWTEAITALRQREATVRNELMAEIIKLQARIKELEGSK